MKRLRRTLLTTVTALSFLLCLTSLVAWPRSYNIADEIRVANQRLPSYFELTSQGKSTKQPMAQCRPNTERKKHYPDRGYRICLHCGVRGRCGCPQCRTNPPVEFGEFSQEGCCTECMGRCQIPTTAPAHDFDKITRFGHYPQFTIDKR